MRSIAIVVLLWPIIHALSVRSEWQGNSGGLVVNRSKRTRLVASLKSQRPPECVDESLNLMFGDHYNPVHIKSALLGGRECRIKDFDFPKQKNLGSGGYGTVKTATHRSTNRTFAVKSIIEMNPDWHKWIRAEECIQYGLEFPFITKHYCTMVHDWYTWLVLELVDGTTLRRRLQSRAVAIDARRVIAQLIVSVEYLELNNIVMGDMTSANVMIDTEGNVKIIDFGFALRRDPSNALSAPTWDEGRALPDFSSSPYNDWYAVGKLLFEILASLRPVECESVSEEEEPVNPNSPSKANPEYRFARPEIKKRHSNCAWLSSNMLRLERCEEILNDPTACELIGKFIGFVEHEDWKHTWGLTKDTKKAIRTHSWFDGFNWSSLDNQTRRFMIRNNYNA